MLQDDLFCRDCIARLATDEASLAYNELAIIILHRDKLVCRLLLLARPGQIRIRIELLLVLSRVVHCLACGLGVPLLAQRCIDVVP